jgi:broad specificity phosphatase PhoE
MCASAAAPPPRAALLGALTEPIVAVLRAIKHLQQSLWLGLCAKIAQGAEEYRKAARPRRIFLVRHGQSHGNVDETLYSLTPDHAMELTELGIEQARVAGRFLRERIGDKPVHCFLSPYTRASQTLSQIVTAFDSSKFAIREDPLLREQEFGNFQDVELIRRSKAERRRYGRFWYRFANGESGADVHNRAADFLSTLFRQMDLASRREAQHYVIIAHGLFVRLFCMRYMGWTVAQFEQVWNPSNCEIWQLDKQSDGRYYLARAYRPQLNAKDEVRAMSSRARIARSATRTARCARAREGKRGRTKAGARAHALPAHLGGCGWLTRPSCARALLLYCALSSCVSPRLHCPCRGFHRTSSWRWSNLG